MSYKWDDESISIFLTVYKKYPCLWNPYHKNYYDCSAKNKALRKIVAELNIPGFTVADYVRQIKIIREKYEKEQIKTIRGLQSEKPYKSPYVWYDHVASMLTKVINDEEKLNRQKLPAYLEEPVVNVLSTDQEQSANKRQEAFSDIKLKIIPCVNETCNSVVRKRPKSVEKFYPYIPRHKVTLKRKKSENKPDLQTKYIPCPSIKFRTGNVLKLDGEKEVSANYEPTKDTGPNNIGKKHFDKLCIIIPVLRM